MKFWRLILYNFTFIIPVHNGMPYIQDCIESILNQTYQNFNIIVLENSSDDGTIEYLKSLTDKRIEIQQSDKLLTIEENWARIINTKREEFMVITCADDCYHENYLSEIVNLIKKHPKASLYRTSVEMINEKSEVTARFKMKKSKMQEADYLKGRLTHTYFETFMGYAFRSYDYNDVGGIDCVHNLLHPDDVLFMKLTRKSYMALSEKFEACYRSHSKSVSTHPKSQIALDGYNYFFNYIFNLKNTKLIKIVKDYLPYHISQIEKFFEPEQVEELKNMYKTYDINPNDLRHKWIDFKTKCRQEIFVKYEEKSIKIRFFRLKIRIKV